MTTILPAGTTLTNPVVNVDGGVARIDLSSDVAELPARARNILYTQFMKTFTSLAGVSGVELLANGALLESENIADIPSYPYSGSEMLVLSDGKPAVVKDDGLHFVPNSEGLASLDLSDLATPYGEKLADFVALGQGGQTIYRIDAAGVPIELLSGQELVSPSIDRHRFVWTAERSPDQQLTAIDMSSGQRARVEATWLDGYKIRSLAVSREGGRIVMLAEHEGVSQALVAGIVRDGAGVPQSLSEPIRVGQRLSEMTDVAWVSDSRLVVIGKSQTSSMNALYSVPLGESISVMSSLEDMTSVTAGRNDDSIVLHTAANDVYAYDAGGWRRILENAIAPTFPG